MENTERKLFDLAVDTPLKKGTYYVPGDCYVTHGLWLPDVRIIAEGDVFVDKWTTVGNITARGNVYLAATSLVCIVSALGSVDVECVTPVKIENIGMLNCVGHIAVQAPNRVNVFTEHEDVFEVTCLGELAIHLIEDYTEEDET